jgi:5,10-methylenetetrahydromethanopterin reductase
MNGASWMHPSFGIRIPACEPLREVAAAARVAEAGGFDCIWTLDSPLLAGRLLDPYLALAACAATTSRVSLGVAVTNPFTRHPIATACSILSLDDLSRGRAVLGIGSGDSAMRTLGLDPADAQGTHRGRRGHVRETVEILNTIFRGAAVTFGTRTFQLDRPARRIPIYVAATGPRMLELAGEIADGVIIQVGAYRPCLTWALEHVRAGAARARRDPGEIDTVCSTFTAITADKALAIDRARPLAAWFYAVAPELLKMAGIRVTQRQPARPVFPDISHPANHEEAMAEARRYVSDEAVRKFCLVGPAEDCVRWIREVAELGFRQIFFRHYLTYCLPTETIEIASREIIPHFR